MNPRKVLEKVLAGSRNIRFGDIVGLTEAFGFRLSRVRGSHHIFVHTDITELLNLQNVGGEVKPYQVRQLIKLVERYNLSMKDAP